MAGRPGGSSGGSGGRRPGDKRIAVNLSLCKYVYGHIATAAP
jgi:hypothetical protein